MAVALPRTQTHAQFSAAPPYSAAGESGSVAAGAGAKASGDCQAAVLARLRGAIAAAEARAPGLSAATTASPVGIRRAPPGRMALGADPFDAALGGGWPLAGLGELHAPAARDAGALSGFAAGLLVRLCDLRPGLVLWVMAGTSASEAGLPYGPGLADLGLDPARLMLAAPRRLADGLWIAEEAAASAGLCAVVFELRAPAARPDLKETRRLHLRATGNAMPMLLLRHDGAAAPPTAAPLRLSVSSAPAVCDPQTGAIGPPGFCITIDRNRVGPSPAGSAHILVWKSHERRFAPLAVSAPAIVTSDLAAEGNDRDADHAGLRAAGTTDRVAAFADAGDRSQPSRPSRPGMAIGWR